MIDDAAERLLIAEEWHSVRHSQGRITAHTAAASVRSGFMLAAVYDDIYALFLPFGCSVLEHALQQMGHKGTLTYRGNKLGRLMEAAKDLRLWPGNYGIVAEACNARDDLAHRRVVPISAKTFVYLDAIEAALIHWKVLVGPVKYTFEVSITRTS
jgi:hypothetical protein